MDCGLQHITVRQQSSTAAAGARGARGVVRAPLCPVFIFSLYLLTVHPLLYSSFTNRPCTVAAIQRVCVLRCGVVLGYV